MHISPERLLMESIRSTGKRCCSTGRWLDSQIRNISSRIATLQLLWPSRYSKSMQNNADSVIASGRLPKIVTASMHESAVSPTATMNPMASLKELLQTPNTLLLERHSCANAQLKTVVDSYLPSINAVCATCMHAPIAEKLLETRRTHLTSAIHRPWKVWLCSKEIVNPVHHVLPSFSKSVGVTRCGAPCVRHLFPGELGKLFVASSTIHTTSNTCAPEALCNGNQETFHVEVTVWITITEI